MSSEGIKVGRPAKPRLARNVSDASAATLTRIESAIAPVVKATFPQLSDSTMAALLPDLAYELAAFPALAGLVSTQQPTKRGPKPRLDHAAFASTVRSKLRMHGVDLPQWENGREDRNELRFFCAELGRVAGIRGIALSAKTARKLLGQGFVGADGVSAKLG